MFKDVFLHPCLFVTPVLTRSSWRTRGNTWRSPPHAHFLHAFIMPPDTYTHTLTLTPRAALSLACIPYLHRFFSPPPILPLHAPDDSREKKLTRLPSRRWDWWVFQDNPWGVFENDAIYRLSWVALKTARALLILFDFLHELTYERGRTQYEHPCQGSEGYCC